jgi:hypothetical protein
VIHQSPTHPLDKLTKGCEAENKETEKDDDAGMEDKGISRI